MPSPFVPSNQTHLLVKRRHFASAIPRVVNVTETTQAPEALCAGVYGLQQLIVQVEPESKEFIRNKSVVI